MATASPDFISRAGIASSPHIEEYRVRQLAADQIEVALRTTAAPPGAEIKWRLNKPPAALPV